MAEDQNQNGPAQITTPAQYPNATRIENGIAYDIKGNALGPYDEGTQASQQQGDDYFEKLGGKTIQASPEQTAQQQQGDDYFMKLGAKEIAPAASTYERLTNPDNELDPVTGLPKAGTASRVTQTAGASLMSLPGMLYHAVTDPTTDEEKELFAKEGHSIIPGEITLERLTGARAIVEAGKAYANPETRPTLKGALSVLPEALGGGVGQVAGGEILGKVSGTATEQVRNALRSDRVALDTASKAHSAADQVHQQALNDMGVATRQAQEAADRASQARQGEAAGTVTRAQRIEAENTASEAAANANKAREAVKTTGETRATAAIERDRLQRKVERGQVKVTERTAKAQQGAKEDFQRAIPSADRGLAKYTDEDYNIGRRYLEQHHENINDVKTVPDVYNAFDTAQKSIENTIRPYAERYAGNPIASDPIMDVRDELRDNPRLDFVEDGMKHLSEKYGDLSNLTIGEAEQMRQNLNSANRDALAQNGWDITTRLDVDPAFAARHALAESLRNGIYNALEDEGVQGIRELRKDETSIIRLRNAAQKAMSKADSVVRGSGESGPLRQKVGRAAPYVGGTLGAGAGALAGSPFGGVGITLGGEAGTAGGIFIGKKLGQRFAPGDLTRNGLVERSMKVQNGIPTRGITEMTPNPANGLAPAEVRALMRENSPVHTELATHYGVSSNGNSYAELAQRFKEDLQDKQTNGLPLDASEKKILGMLNKADDADALAARQEAMQPKQPLPTATLPEKLEPVLRVPNKLANGMITEDAIAHDIAHAVVGRELGFDFPDGIRSHLHGENVKAGSLMSAPVDLSKFFDAEGNIDPLKAAPKMADIAAMYVAGGVANDLFHDVPFTENHALGADIGILQSFMKKVGFTDVQSAKMLAQAADRARMILDQPGVRDVIERHAAVREAGLDERYHISPDRLDQILADVRGEEYAPTDRNASGTNGAGNGSAKEAGAGEVGQNKANGSEAVSKPGQGTGEAKGKTDEAASKSLAPKYSHAGGTDVISAEEAGRQGVFVKIGRGGAATFQGKTPDFNLKPGEAGYHVVGPGDSRLVAGEETPATKKGVESFAQEKFNPKFDQTPKQIVEGEGLKYKGELTKDSGVHMFEHPNHPGMTAAINEPITPERVREKMASKLKEFGVGQSTNPKFDGDRVSTRVPEGKNATENPLQGEPLVVGRESLSQAPEKLQEKFANTIKKYPGIKIPAGVKDPGKIMDRFVRHVADNLKFLYDQVTPEKQAANAKWYESANKLSKELSDKHGITQAQGAGVIATQSPQKDWDMNVSLARRIADIYKNQQETKTTPQMMQKGRDIIKTTGANKDLEKVLPGLEGKKLSEITDLYDRAAWVRLYDEAHNPREFHHIDPGTGNNAGLRLNANGAPSKVAWGSLPQIENALSIMEDGSRGNISKRLGGMHKVRNFYNNIIDPTNDQDVTIDTHAVGAGLMQPLSGNSTEVLHNFGNAGKHIGTGTMGTYPLYADAYRTAAKELGILPRELQSVTWEKIREMFPAEWKSAENEKAVKGVWKKYADGKQSLNETRNQIMKISDQAQNKVEQARQDTLAKAQAKQQKQLDKQAAKQDNNAGVAALRGAK